MPTIVVCGAGPGLGRSVARRYGREGYEVVLVARHAEPLESFAAELAEAGITAHPLPSDLSDPDDMGDLAVRIRQLAGDPDVLYYAPVAAGMTVVPAAKLTAEA
ncbi:MAG: SDR family NAD(P)-dependent oxidoreductase, partial [Propionicimonas sp.]|nr:SDR family NAD(P)-dependent oxidoreductase [Propionicimonas sp.]